MCMSMFCLFFLQQEKYTEIILAKEMKRITEDMQLKDLKVKTKDLLFFA